MGRNVTSQSGQTVSGDIVGSRFSIKCLFSEDFPEDHHSIFAEAANRWTRVITGDFAPWSKDGVELGSLMIAVSTYEGQHGGQLARGGPTAWRDPAVRPLEVVAGHIEIDAVDLGNDRKRAWWLDVISHEMGHVLGIGTLWVRPYSSRDLVDWSNPADVSYTGAAGISAYRELASSADIIAVPVAAAKCHWRDSVFGRELMTETIAGPGNPLSILSARSLEDLGYQVSSNLVDPYQLPAVGAYLDKEECEPLIFECRFQWPAAS